MTKDEALKLALEALVAAFQGKDKTGQVTDAITAIKEALASSVATSDTSEKRVDETAKQRHEQEPVAWRFRSGTWFNREVHWRYIDTLEGSEGLLGLQPLYTTPPHRKPLTDEEIDLIGKRMFGAGQAVNTDRDFARAIEAAHGIKE